MGNNSILFIWELYGITKANNDNDAIIIWIWGI